MTIIHHQIFSDGKTVDLVKLTQDKLPDPETRTVNDWSRFDVRLTPKAHKIKGLGTIACRYMLKTFMLGGGERKRAWAFEYAFTIEVNQKYEAYKKRMQAAEKAALEAGVPAQAGVPKVYVPQHSSREAPPEQPPSMADVGLE